MRFRLVSLSWILLAIVIIDLLGFGIIVPVLPILFSKVNFSLPSIFGAGREQSEYLAYGLITATYPIFQFISTPILGQLADRFGRRSILLACLIGNGLSFVIFAIGIYTQSIWILLFSRIIGGIMGGNIAIVQAIIADTTESHERTKAFGLIGAGYGIGLIIGPYIGGKLSDSSVVPWFQMDTPFIFAALLCFINVVLVWSLLPETLKKENRALHLNFTRSMQDIMQAFRYNRVSVLFLSGFLFQFAFTMFVSFFGVLLYKRFGFTQGTIGEYFAYAGLWIGITQIFITKWAHKRFGDLNNVRIGLVGCTIFSFILFFHISQWALYLITALFAIANGITQTSILSLVSNSAEHGSHGKIMGINSSLYALATAIPPMISGIIAASNRVESPILVSSVLIFLATVTFFAYKPQVHHQHTS